MATLYLDFEGGNDANNGTSFANRKKTLAGASAVAAAGDTVRVMASSAPVSLGTNGTFARGSATVTLAAAQTVTLDQGETAWTASANVTCTTSTTRKQGATSSSIAIAAGFTTGLAAYVALGGSTDLSGYQQLSFWIQQTAGTLAANCSIRICSDAVGAVSVDTFTIPACAVLSGWHRVVVNLGGAMSAAAQSVAFYVDSDQAAQTFLIDNIVAAKAVGATGELHLKTLIGKANSLGAGGDDSETWYSIRAIEGTTITLDLLNSSNAGSTTNGRYWGVSETVTAYSMVPSWLPTSVATADCTWTTGGTDASTLTLSGGWNRTDMTTQTGQTWCSLGNQPSATTSVVFVCSYLSLSRLHFFGFSGSLTITSENSTFSTCHFLSMSGANFNGYNNTGTALVFRDSGGTTFQWSFSTVGLSSLTDQAALSFGTSVGSTFTLTSSSVAQNLTLSSLSQLVFNGETYGSHSEADMATTIFAKTGDTGVSLSKMIEMFAAFVAGKVSVSSAGGVSTYTYKKRDGSTTSFTSLCSESDGTRATTGSLS